MRRLQRYLVALALLVVPSMAAAQSPMPSPNAAAPLIVYQTNTGVPEDGIWTIFSDGTHPVELAGEVDGAHLHPDWSPTGERIVFEVQYGEEGTLWTVDSDGAHSALLTECAPPCLRLEYPAWSPDGTQIAYVSIEDLDGVEGPPDATAIQIYDLATQDVTEVMRTSFPTLMTGPRWSPDGSTIVVAVEHLDPDANDLGAAIAVVEAGGGTLEEVTDPAGFNFYPDWNPSQDLIVFDEQALQWALDPPADDETWNLYMAASDGSGLRQITDVDAGTKLFQPSWTPDGTRIIATMDGPNGRMAVFVDVDSGEVTVIHGRLATHARVQPGQ